MNKNNRITYRFDRTGQTVEENSRKDSNSVPQQVPARDQSKSSTPSKVVPLYSNTEYENGESPFSPWISPFQEDIIALEDLIRDTDRKSVPASAKKQAESPAQEVYPAAEHVQEPVSQPKKKGQWHPRQRVESESKPQSEMKPQMKPPAEVLATDVHPMMNQWEGLDDDSFYPELELDNKSAKRWSRPVQRYSTPPSWIKVFLSVAGALATGALFGYLLLSLFTNSPDQTSGTNNLANPVNGSVSNNPSAAPSGDKSTNTNGGTSGSAVNDASGQKTVKLTIPTQSYQLLQYGVFSNTEGRDAAIKELTDKGLAAAGMKTVTDYRVYAGMAIDRARAITLTKDIGEELPVYIKQVDVQVPQQFPFAGDAKAADTFLNNTINLISMLDELSLTQLEQPSLSPLGSAAADAWQAEHQKWTESVKAMQAGVQDEAGKAFLIKLIQSMNTAAKSLEEYDKKPSESHLWAVQGALMEAIVTQKEWYEPINAL